MSDPSFVGFVSAESTTDIKTIVSFPGIYEADWGMLVESSTKLQGGEDGYQAVGSTACVFLPKGSSHFADHAKNVDDPQQPCWCMSLYGSEADFGCKWFEEWRKQLEKAVEKNHTLVVVFKAGDTPQGPDDDSTEWMTKYKWPPKLKCNEANKGMPELGVSQRGEVAYLKKCLDNMQPGQRNRVLVEDILNFRKRLLDLTLTRLERDSLCRRNDIDERLVEAHGFACVLCVLQSEMWSGTHRIALHMRHATSASTPTVEMASCTNLFVAQRQNQAS